MQLPILIEPNYKNSYWCSEIMKGIKKQTYARKISINILDEEFLEELNSSSAQKVVLVISSSLNWINQIILKFRQLGIHMLLVSSDFGTEHSQISCVHMNYQFCIFQLLGYLKDFGDSKTALFGVNPNSYADVQKIAAFENKKDIYYNFGSIDTCTLQFWKSIDFFDSVICANDAVAIHLAHFLKEKEFPLNKKFHMVSFGDFFISRLINGTMASIELDYYVLGQQAVDTYQFLSRTAHPITINISLECRLYVQNPELSGIKKIIKETELPKDFVDVDFYSDPSVIPILALENMMVNSDKIDVQIIGGFFKRMTQEKIAETLNLSLSALRYRIKRLNSFYPEVSFKELISTIAEYISYEELILALKFKDL